MTPLALPSNQQLQRPANIAWKDSRCSTTLRPLGPKVTLTALATALMPPWSLGGFLLNATGWVWSKIPSPNRNCRTRKWCIDRNFFLHVKEIKHHLLNEKRSFFFGICQCFQQRIHLLQPKKTWHQLMFPQLTSSEQKLVRRHFCCPASLKEIFLAAWQLGSIPG